MVESVIKECDEAFRLHWGELAFCAHSKLALIHCHPGTCRPPIGCLRSPWNNIIEYTMFSLYNGTNLRKELATCPKAHKSLRDLCACGGLDL